MPDTSDIFDSGPEAATATAEESAGDGRMDDQAAVHLQKLL